MLQIRGQPHLRICREKDTENSRFNYPLEIPRPISSLAAASESVSFMRNVTQQEEPFRDDTRDIIQRTTTSSWVVPGFHRGGAGVTDFRKVRMCLDQRISHQVSLMQTAKAETELKSTECASASVQL